MNGKDFGGGREASDYDAAATAGPTMSEQIRQHIRTLEVVHELRQGKYHMYVCQTPFIDPLMFQLATQQNQQSAAIGSAEKTKFCWVRLQDVLRAVAAESQQYYLRIPYRQLAIKRPGCRHMQLHPCFARSLRLAQARNIAALVSEMQKQPVLPQLRAGRSEGGELQDSVLSNRSAEVPGPRPAAPVAIAAS